MLPTFLLLPVAAVAGGPLIAGRASGRTVSSSAAGSAAEQSSGRGVQERSFWRVGLALRQVLALDQIDSLRSKLLPRENIRASSSVRLGLWAWRAWSIGGRQPDGCLRSPARHLGTDAWRCHLLGRRSVWSGSC